MRCGAFFGRTEDGLQSVFLGSDHPYELTAASQKRLELKSLIIGQRLSRGLSEGSEPSDDYRIQLVCFRENPPRFGEVADLSWIYDGERNLRGG